MTHEALREKLLDLAYGELSPREAREVEGHAAACAECAAELARTRGTRAVMRKLPDEPAPDAGERILVAAAREAAEARARSRRLPRWIWNASAVAALAVVVAGVSYQILERRGPARRDDLALLGSGAPPPPAPEAPAAPAPSPRAAPAPPEDQGFLAERREAPRREAAPASEPGRARAVAPAPSKAVPPAPAAPAFAKAPPAAAPEADADAAVADRRAAAAPPAAPPREAKKAARAEQEAPASAMREEAAPAPAPAAPPRAAAGAGAMATRAPSAAPPPAAQRAPSDAADRASPAAALARYESLRAAGRLRGAFRTFPDCAGEAWRKVETDPDGRVVTYVRQGRVGSRSLRIEHLYAADGSLARVTARDAETGDPVDLAGTGVDPPRRAADATLDAEPRCTP